MRKKAAVATMTIAYFIAQPALPEEKLMSNPFGGPPPEYGGGMGYRSEEWRGKINDAEWLVILDFSEDGTDASHLTIMTGVIEGRYTECHYNGGTQLGPSDFFAFFTAGECFRSKSGSAPPTDYYNGWDRNWYNKDLADLRTLGCYKTKSNQWEANCSFTTGEGSDDWFLFRGKQSDF